MHVTCTWISKCYCYQRVTVRRFLAPLTRKTLWIVKSAFICDGLLRCTHTCISMRAMKMFGANTTRTALPLMFCDTHRVLMQQSRRSMGDSQGRECLLPQENKKVYTTGSESNLFRLLDCFFFFYWENHNKPTCIKTTITACPRYSVKQRLSTTERHLYVVLELDSAWTATGFRFGITTFTLSEQLLRPC